MEFSILALLSALCLLAAPAWAADPTPQCRCSPNVWTAKVNLNQGVNVGNGGRGDTVQYGEGTQYGDLNKGWIVIVVDTVPGGQTTMYLKVDDALFYIKTATGCMKVPSPIPRGAWCWFNNTKMEFKGTETFGNGDVEVWQSMDKSSGVFIKQYVSTISPEECFPTYHTYTVTSESYTYVMGMLSTDFKASVDDPSIFDFPDECKNAGPVPSGAQAKRMSVLALVSIFVLHLGL